MKRRTINGAHGFERTPRPELRPTDYATEKAERETRRFAGSFCPDGKPHYWLIDITNKGICRQCEESRQFTNRIATEDIHIVERMPAWEKELNHKYLASLMAYAS